MLVITGASGFLGRAVAGRISGARCLSSKDLDLTDGRAVEEAMAEWKPSVVVHLAARVGGIVANMNRQADFIVDNLRMDANLLAALRTHRPDHLIAMLSTCMYPAEVAEADYPMAEDLIDAGPPPPTNAAYAVAKRALWEGVRALNEQYGVQYSNLVPANLYGPGDHFGHEFSHFLAAAVTKVERARLSGDLSVEFFGTGRALRQYLYVDDLANLVSHLVDLGPLNTTVNVAPSQNLTIREFAQAVSDAAGYKGAITFSMNGPDGQYRKDVSAARLRELVPEWVEMETPLEVGLTRTIEWYRQDVAPR
jgi:GDP-L-fucose synthase